MKLFDNSGKHSSRGKSPARERKGKPADPHKDRGKKVVSQSGNRHEKEDFNRRMAESLGYTTKNLPSKKSEKKRKLLIVGVVAACLALIAILCVAGFMIWSEPPEVVDGGLKVHDTPAPSDDIPTDTTAATEVPVTPTPAPTPDPSVLRRRDNTYTVLVVGRDRVGMNTDTIMLAMLDGEKNELNVVSIPRDTLVNVSWSVKKINSMYGALGTEGLVNGVEDLIGYEIDNYVIVNTYVFQELIDAIGGVYFDVPLNMYYDDPGQNLHIHINAGYQWLSGAQSEQVVRFRQNNDGTGYPTGDLGRIETQQKFAMALAKQLLSLGNIKNLPELVDIVVSNTDTDLTSGNMAFYVEEFLKLSSDSIHFYTLPCTNANILGGSYVSILLDEWLNMINSHFNPYNLDVSQSNLNILMYANGATWSTTGRSQPISSFYDYNAANATPVPPPVVNQAPPAVEQAPPPVEQAPPAVEQAPPPAEQAPPAVEQAPPVVEQAPPAVEPAPAAAEPAPEG